MLVLNVSYYRGISWLDCTQDNRVDDLENVFEFNPYFIVFHNCERLDLLADEVLSNPEFNAWSH